MEYVEKILSFLCDHIELCVACAVGLVTLVIQLVKKKPIDGVKAQLFELIIQFIKKVEKEHPHGDGVVKREEVIKLVNAFLEVNYPKLVGVYDDFIIKTIENILLTPQKKGE